MSKLIDKLNQEAKDIPQSMGFRATQPTATKPKMLLIASLAHVNSAGHLTEHITGADAVLITDTGLEAKSIQQIARSFADIPWGLWLGDISQKEITRAEEAGCDFVIFPADRTLAMPGNNKVGKILQVEKSLSEGLLKAVNELPLDAVLIAEEPKKDYVLTWHHLMLYQRFADLLTKPLLVSIPLKITKSELQILWERGIDGLVVAVEIGEPAGSLKELRQIIDKLTFPSHRHEKAIALLPRIGEETSPITEAEEEEEE